MSVEFCAARYFARYGEERVWLHVMSEAARIMVAWEAPVSEAMAETELVQALVRLDVFLELVGLSGVMPVSVEGAAGTGRDPDAWSRPGLTLARLVFLSAAWLRHEQVALDLAAVVADALTVVRRMSLQYPSSVREELRVCMLSKLCA